MVVIANARKLPNYPIKMSSKGSILSKQLVRKRFLAGFHLLLTPKS